MSTDVDNAPPAAAPDPDDDGPYPGRSADGAVDAGADWVRAEMQRRMIENRSVRGRHARAADTGRAPTPARGLPRVEPRPGALPRQPPAAPVSPADLPENYVPRHSVQTPGPAAEPAPPITGPIPVVRPPADLPVRRRPPRPAPDAAGPRSVPPAPRPGRPGPVAPRPAAAGPETSSGPVGGPSLPPQGLPVRRRRGSGPGTPLQADVTTAPETWSRPIPVVPAEPARPPGCAAGEGPADVPWGSPGAPAGPVPPPAAGPAPSDAPPSDTPVPDVGEPAPAATPAADAAPADPGPSDPGPSDPGPSDPGPSDPGPSDTALPRAAKAVAERMTAPQPVVPEAGSADPGPVVRVPRPRSGEQLPAAPLAAAERPVLRRVTVSDIPVVGTAPPDPGSTRVRVVLSERKGVARPVRTIKEVQEGTAVGELLRNDLIRSQLKVTLRFALLTAFVLGTLPAVFALLPVVGQARVLGVGLSWVVLGVLMYPFLVVVAWRYVRVADRVEQNFADHVQD